MGEVRLDKSFASHSETHAGLEFLKIMDGEEWVAKNFERILPAIWLHFTVSWKGTVVMKCKTYLHKVDAKSKFGIYIFIVETDRSL